MGFEDTLRRVADKKATLDSRRPLSPSALNRLVIRREDRLAYYDTLDKAHAGDAGPFVMMVADAAERSLDIYLAA